jgi:predicted nucleic acid-binding protein
VAFVVDASVALAWLFNDEESDFADAVLERLHQESGAVPSVWPLEVANGLLMGERRGRITAAEVVEAIEQTLGLPIEIHYIAPELALGRVLQLAQTHTLTVYDAAYLELAMREALPLATLDDDLLAAAQHVGLPELA